MSKGYVLFLLLMTLVLLIGVVVLIHGLTNPTSLPRLAMRSVCAWGYWCHG